MLDKLAPHLAQPVPFLYPMLRTGDRPGVRRAGHRGLRRDGCRAWRAVATCGTSGARRPSRCSRRSNREAVRGSILFYEGQVDDARHTMMLSRTAAHYGAAVASSTRVVGFVRDEDRVAGCPGPRPGVGPGDRDPRPADRSTPPGSGSTRSSRCSGGRGTVPGPGLQGHPPGRAAEPDQRALRADHPDREEPAVRHPVAQPLAHRHHRHRLAARSRPSGGQSGRHRLPARPGQPAARRPAHPRRRGRCLRRACVRCCPESPTRPPSCPASTRSPPRSAA